MKFIHPSIILAGIIFLSFAALSHSAPYYTQANMTAGNQTIENLSLWFDQSTGGGNSPLTFNGNQFYSNGFALRSGISSTTWGNASTALFLNSGIGVGQLGTNTLTIANLTTYAGASARINPRSNNGIANLAVSNFTNDVNTMLDSTSSNINRSISLSIGTLTGAGDFLIHGNSGGTNGADVFLSVTNASGFTGDIRWGTSANTVLSFQNDLNSAGALIALSTSRISLHQDVSFASVTLNGFSLAQGTYSYSYLNTNFDAIFLDGGSGSITVVPEPATGMLLGVGLMVFLGKRSARRRRL